jgi:predicted NUDIX family phosphoesterase
MPKEERVLCFERKLFEDLGAFDGISLNVEKYLPVVTSASHLVYLNRSEAEHDPRYKQIIPYVLVICRGKILRYRRGRAGQETRLHGLYSVGIGGHIAEEDHGLFSQDRGYEEGMRREVWEELGIKVSEQAAVAVINDDSTEVGRVHFGIVHVLPVAEEEVATRRTGIVSPEFVPFNEAAENLSDYESWSRFCLAQLNGLLAKATASGVAVPERLVA